MGGVASGASKLCGVPFLFSSNGFDPDTKKEAARVANGFNRTGEVLAAAAVGATIVVPVAAVGLGFAAAVSPVLASAFRRVRDDPADPDFTSPVTVRPVTIDPTVLSAGSWQLEGERLVAGLPTLTLALDRAAAYLDAVVTAGERAMGAWNERSLSGVELRLADARRFAMLASASLSTAAHAARSVVADPQLETLAYRARGKSQRREAFLSALDDRTVAAMRSAGFNRADFPLPRFMPSQSNRIDETLHRGLVLIEQICVGMPSADEFIGEGDERAAFLPFHEP